MAKDTIDTIKRAEISANQLIYESKEQCNSIIQDANEQKIILLKEVNAKIIASSKEVELQAKNQSTKMIDENMEKVKDTLTQLENKYSNKKVEAISLLTETVLA